MMDYLVDNLSCLLTVVRVSTFCPIKVQITEDTRKIYMFVFFLYHGSMKKTPRLRVFNKTTPRLV